MNKQLLISTVIILTTTMSMPTGAAIARPKTTLPPLEYYHPNDPCFNPVKGYTCIQRSHSHLNNKKNNEKQHDGLLKEVDNYLW